MYSDSCLTKLFDYATIYSFKHKKIAVVGLGVEGLSSVRYFAQKGADVTVLDQNPSFAKASEGKGSKEENDLIAVLKKIGCLFKFGKDYLKNLGEFEIIVRSPGIKRAIQEFQEAEVEGIEITSQTKLFFDLCPCKIIGVTGTKGKGTTSALVYEMLKLEGFDAFLGGNIGTPPLDFLDQLKDTSWVILELSSYQLQDITKSPHIAVLLMMTSDHLSPDRGVGKHENYHKDVHGYVDAKRNLVRFQSRSDYAVINRDYPASHESYVHTEASVFQVSRERGVLEQGCFIKDGKVIIRIVRGPAARVTPREIEVIKTSEILLPGKHNLENVCAAVMAAYLSGVSIKNIQRALKIFKGLEHRLELVGVVNGVRYYDDSFSTTPETAIAAIDAFEEPKIVILGGASKGSDFTELGRVISNSKSIRAVIGIGIEWNRIKPNIQNTKYQILIVEGAKSIYQVVQAASKIAQLGDVVLLSPACSSFDMFKNYKERGDLFKREVEQLVKKSGR